MEVSFNLILVARYVKNIDVYEANMTYFEFSVRNHMDNRKSCGENN